MVPFPMYLAKICDHVGAGPVDVDPELEPLDPLLLDPVAPPLDPLLVPPLEPELDPELDPLDVPFAPPLDPVPWPDDELPDVAPLDEPVVVPVAAPPESVPPTGSEARSVFEAGVGSPRLPPYGPPSGSASPPHAAMTAVAATKTPAANVER